METTVRERERNDGEVFCPMDGHNVETRNQKDKWIEALRERHWGRTAAFAYMAITLTYTRQAGGYCRM